jgi:CheY-like chemotaxis protein
MYLLWSLARKWYTPTKSSTAAIPFRALTSEFPGQSRSACGVDRSHANAALIPTIRKMLCRMFEREENYDLCAEAEDGQQAIELAVQHHPDLIILDLSMPVMNGLEAAHELKKLMPKVPIILFTQHAESGNRIGVMNMDVDRIVAKTEAFSLMGHVRSLAPA